VDIKQKSKKFEKHKFYNVTLDPTKVKLELRAKIQVKFEQKQKLYLEAY